MTDAITQDPAAIERDIRRTQDDMSRTVDKIGHQLSIKNIVNGLLEKADENGVDARMVLDGARRNPVALGLIAAGTIWLVSDKDSKLPSLPKGKSDKVDGPRLGEGDVHHRDYVAHMSAIEWREGEDPVAYQRRRDIARANYFMIERNQEEDDHSFRQRLDTITDQFRAKRRAWSDSAEQAQGAARDKAAAAARKTQQAYGDNPLIGGLLAAAVGAAFGAALPITRQEQDKLGAVGEKARDLVGEQKDKVTAQLREKKDELLDKADQKLQPAASPDQQPGAGKDDLARQDAPFMIGEPSR